MSLRRSPVVWFVFGTLAGGGVTAGLLKLLDRPEAQPATRPAPAKQTPAPAPSTTATKQPTCPGLTAAPAPWTAEDPDATAAKLPPVPASLRQRVAFWKDFWGKYPNRLYLFIDRRRPWVVHTRVSCRDLFPAGGSDPVRERRCDQRLIQARRELVRKLRRQRRRPSRALLQAFGRNKKLARSAYRNVLVLEGRRDSLHQALERSNHYLDDVERVFAAAGLPGGLARIAIIESLADPQAVSPAGAVGAYQFVAGTARQYLMVDKTVDERLDPVREGWAAANYLGELYRQFKSWPLALTAYNTGPSRLKRLVKSRRTRDIGRLADLGNRGGFGFDGQNYYAQFAAVAELTPALVHKGNGRQPVTLRVDEPLPLAEAATCLGVPVEVLARHNPALGKSILAGDTHLPKGYLLALPPDEVRTASQP